MKPMSLIHRTPGSPAARAAQPTQRSDGYDGSFLFFRSLAPVVWLAIVGACLLVALGAVGYLAEDVDPATGHPLLEPFKRFDDALAAPNLATRRAALAASGVTLAITIALAIASAVWAVAAFRGKANAYRLLVLLWVVVFFLLSIGILAALHANASQPFASALVNTLLVWTAPRWPGLSAIGVPGLMFGLACGVPVVLTTGACCLLQPLGQPASAAMAEPQLRLLAGRLKELDQLLYVGALTLVFGTLQLSSGLSVPLSSMPKAADLKVQAELCKSVSPASPASSPFVTPAASAPPTLPAYYEGFGVDQCRKLPQAFAQVEVADDLRQLARGITLSFGLAFSALLAAIYIPALIGLGLLIDPIQSVVDKTARAAAVAPAAAPAVVGNVGDMDPLRRVAAIAATLSPLIAGLLANAFAATG